MHKSMSVTGKLLAAAVSTALGLSGSVLAQDSFPSVSVASKVLDSVVAIDSNSVAYGSVTEAGLGSSRNATLSTRRLTGFVYDAKKGYVVTDSTDIEDAALLIVRLADGTELNGKVVGVDEFYGVGVIQIEGEAKGLKAAKLLDSRYDPLNEVYPYGQGDSVVAVGNSGGMSGTVTYGIISGIRNLRNRNAVLVPSVIQSDVVINFGNEGCPLFDDQGRVIAMHERRGGGGSMQNTTFFTPIWMIRRVVDDIIADSEANREIEVWHPWLGVKPFSGTRSPLGGGIRVVGDDLKMYMDIPEQYWDTGILLDAVYPESPAKEFGLTDKDMLMHVTVFDKNDNVKYPYTLLKQIQDLELLVTTADEGDRFVFGVLRNGKIFDVEVVVDQHPGEFSFVSITGQVLTSTNSSEYF
ncbi:trypsin-like peptidase domain-containing protein [bacterium]|nr:trypsin-like peptidase domain-containing protein [bacterium]